MTGWTSLGIYGTGGQARAGNDPGGFVGRDTSRDQSGDQAAWRELVAQLEVEPAIDPVNAPWPDRENLTPDAPDETGEARSESGRQAPAGRSRVIRPATFLPFAVPNTELEAFATDTDLEFPDDDAPDEDEGYVPPYVPPQPKLDPVARGAWTALFGGPGYLFIATTFGWQVPRLAQLAAIIAFIAGFVILVSRLGDGPSRRDGPDQGAVV
jgi:hypothetical protein